jgi:hypothetical protein
LLASMRRVSPRAVRGAADAARSTEWRCSLDLGQHGSTRQFGGRAVLNRLMLRPTVVRRALRILRALIIRSRVEKPCL